jgi:hypothetical protein
VFPEPADPDVTAVVEPLPAGIPAGVGAEEPGVTDATNPPAAADDVAVEGDLAVEEHPEVVAAERRAERKDRRRARRRSVWRVGRWLIPIVLILAIGFGAVAWYARHRYYVGFDKARVTVFKGVPGGLLFFDPTIERRTTLTASDLTRVERADVRDEKTFSSKSDANAYVAQLRDRAANRDSGTTTSVPTTTTLPGATTTTLPPTTTAPAVPAAPGG